MHALYNLFWHLALPFVPLRLWWRGRKEPLYRHDWSQRFARTYPPLKNTQPLIWLHAVSLGETRAAQPLIHALRAQYPGHAFLITHMTATGRAAAQQLYGDFAELCFLPYDLPWTVTRFLRHYRPSLGIIMETEVWPNLLLRAEALGVPMALVNARLSERSAHGYARFGTFARAAFASFDLVLAQSESDAARLRGIGARNTEVSGNLKFDVPNEAGPSADLFKQWFAVRRVLLLASTREGEEELLLNALADKPLAADVLVVLVPRHPQRFDEIAQMLQKRGIKYVRRSELRGPAPSDAVFLGDSMGEMSAYYAACDLAFIGGSLLNYGAQNLIEACAQGAPVLLGPSTFNFAQAAELAMQHGAAIQVEDAGHLFQCAGALLDDPARRNAMSEAGLAFCAAHRGAARRTVAELAKILGSPD